MALAGLVSTLRGAVPTIRYSLRVSVAGLVAFAIARSLDLPFHGLWAVLTAIVVSQASVGGSLKATLEYNVGTIGGAVYAAVVALALPRDTPLRQALALVVSVAPMAFAAAVNPAFRVAPFSAVLVLLIGGQFGETPIVSAITRVLEVAIGGAVAVVVSLVVLPDSARRQGLKAAGSLLTQIADFLPTLLSRVSRDVDPVDISLAQTRIGNATAALQSLAEDAKREGVVTLGRDPDPSALARTLLRVRHDFVMIARATVGRFPEAVAGRLDPPLTQFGEAASTFLRAAGAALASGAAPPPVDPVEAARAAWDAAVASIRAEGLARALETTDVERFFALGFALEQLCRDLAELATRVREFAGKGARAKSV